MTTHHNSQEYNMGVRPDIACGHPLTKCLWVPEARYNITWYKHLIMDLVRAIL